MVSINQAIQNSNISLEKKTDIYIKKDCLEKAILNSLEKDLKSFPDKKISFSLSGGLDSSLLLAMAVTHFKQYEYTALTIGPSEDYDDIKYSSIVCQNYNIKHIKRIITNELIKDSLPKLEKLNKQFKGQRRRGDGLSSFLLYDFLAEYTNKVIVGDCADELFAGYFVHVSPKENKKFFYSPKNNTEKNLIKSALNYKGDCPNEKNIYSVIDYCWGIISSDYLKYTTAFSENRGLDLRLPYMSKEVITLAKETTLRQKIRDKKRKIILKEIGKDYLPEYVLNRETKQGIPSIIKRPKNKLSFYP